MTAARFRRSGRYSRLTIGVLMLVVLAGCGSGGGSTAGDLFQMVTPGGQLEFDYPIAERKPVGEISGPAVVGDGRISLSDYAGQVVVLNVWGSWCAPCRAEAGYLATAAEKMESAGVQFVGINVRDRRADAADFETNREVPYPSIFDPQMRILLAIRGFPVSSVPATIVLDRQHRVAHIWLMPFASPASLIAEVTRIAGEEPPPPADTGTTDGSR